MIRKLNKDELNGALSLVRKVYYETEYVNDTQEGRITFEKEFLNDPSIKDKNEFYGCFSGNQLVGVTGFQKNGYIQFLFVDTEAEGQGVGTRLITEAISRLKEEGHEEIRLDSTVFGHGFYQKMGFNDIGGKKCENGMSYIPMVKKL